MSRRWLRTNAVSQVNKNDFPFPFELRNHWWEIELLARNGNGPAVRGREPIVSMHKMCARDKNRQPAAVAHTNKQTYSDRFHKFPNRSTRVRMKNGRKKTLELAWFVRSSIKRTINPLSVAIHLSTEWNSQIAYRHFQRKENRMAGGQTRQ